MLDSHQTIESIESNLTKMGRLVVAQLEASLECFHARDLMRAEEVIERDDVIDNLKLRIEEYCFDLATSGSLSASDVCLIRAMITVAINLERCGDAGAHIAKKLRAITRDGIETDVFDYAPVDDLALKALDESTRSFLDRNVDMAQLACSREPELDAQYVVLLRTLLSRMREEPQLIPYLMHCSSILKYLERVADYSLNIGEQAIFAVTGRRLKFAQYQQLDRLVGTSFGTKLQFRPYWDGISGAIVALIDSPDSIAVYKEGSRRKIQAEVEKLEVWQRIAPKNTLRVLGSVNVGDRQALLREFANGTVLADLFLSQAPWNEKAQATYRLLAAIQSIWDSTREPIPPKVDYIEQVRKRLDDVWTMHPGLRDLVKTEFSGSNEAVANWLTAANNGSKDLPENAIDLLLDAAQEKQSSVAPPFSVWLHGDFNANNIVVDPLTREPKFIDVHRSRQGDFLQDISVFLVSLERQKITDPKIQSDLARIAAQVTLFAETYARIHGDTQFEKRLALAFCRSYLTSCRVVLDEEVAQRLLQKGLNQLSQFLEEA